MDLYLLSITAVLEGVKTFSQTFNKQKVLFISNNKLQQYNNSNIGNFIMIYFRIVVLNISWVKIAGQFATRVNLCNCQKSRQIYISTSFLFMTLLELFNCYVSAEDWLGGETCWSEILLFINQCRIFHWCLWFSWQVPCKFVVLFSVTIIIL